MSDGKVLSTPPIAGALFVYCASGTLLTLANKLAVLALPAPHALLVFQNGVTVLLLLALTHAVQEHVGGPLPPLTWHALRTWLPLTLLFVGMLATSLLALLQVSAVTLIVFRNLGSLMTAFFERAVLGTEISTLSVASLLGILFGVILYALHDLQFSAVGYTWLTLNVACTAAFQIYVKGLIAAQPTTGPGALGPFGMSYYNNLISLPVFALVAAGARELQGLSEMVAQLSASGWAAVVLSALLGFALSTSAFLVNKLVSATSMMVANNVNKFALIIVSELVVQRTLGPLAALGTALVIAFAWLYAESRGRWASSGWPHDALCALGTRRLLISVSFVAAHVCLSAIVASPPHHALYNDRFIPRRIGRRWTPQPGIRSDNVSTFYVTDWEACPLSAGEPGFKRKCNVEGWCAGLPPFVTAFNDLPHTTPSGERVQDAIQRTLRAAWGPDPPQIDLYLRAGCGATTELAYLLPTIELFWPEHLGEVIIALDAGNHASLEHFLPIQWRSTKQSYHFVYEEVPCIPARVFNQISYLNLDLHSNAQYIVTIDSDCTFHTPVTPDLLFDEHARLLLPVTTLFQRGYWGRGVEFFTGIGTFTSHTMVTQPVSFARVTFLEFRERMFRSERYFDSVSTFVKYSHTQGDFCWMCQLGTFLQMSDASSLLYRFIDVDDHNVSNVFRRFAAHVTYELFGSYADTVTMLTAQGICKSLNVSTSMCSQRNADKLNWITTHYNGYPLGGSGGENGLQPRCLLGV